MLIFSFPLFSQMSSVLLSVGGIVFMGYGEGFNNPSTLGILFAALAALMSSIFQVSKD